MCGRSAAQIWYSPPVRSIVTGVFVGAAEIGYFIMLVSCILQMFDQQCKELQTGIFVYFLYLMLLQHIIYRCIFFVSQMVSRNMLYIQADSLPEVVFPPSLCFARQSVNQINADILKSRFSAPANSFDGCLGIMATFQ